MSSLNIINRSVASFRGGGLPFYTNNAYIFSPDNNGFNSNVGLWQVPTNKIPTFQVWVDGIYDTVSTFDFLETKGNNEFIGTFTPPIGAVQGYPVETNGNNEIVYQTSDSGTLITPIPQGRYVINLILSNTLGTQFLELWSEEFMALDC